MKENNDKLKPVIKTYITVLGEEFKYLVWVKDKQV
jgi:hypothetical protein